MYNMYIWEVFHPVYDLYNRDEGKTAELGTRRRINTEPNIYLIEKKNHLNRTSIFGFKSRSFSRVYT